MKIVIRILLLITISLESSAAIHGNGRGSVEIDLDENEIVAKVEGNYNGSVEAKNYDVNSSLAFEKLFDDGRSDSNHGSEYYTTYINSVIDHKYRLITPNLSWESNTKFNYNTDTVNTEPQSWSLLTGPKYLKYIRSDIKLELELQKARELDRQYLRDEIYGTIRLTKSINTGMDFTGEFERYCTDYNNEDAIDSCSNEASAEIMLRQGVSDYRAKVGRFISHNKVYPTYEADYNYTLNTSNIISLQFIRKNNSINNSMLTTANSLLPDPATFTTSKIGRYLYDFKQLNLLLEMNTSETKTETQLTQEKRYSMQVDYRLLNNSCKACLLNVSVDSNDNDAASWQSASVGIAAPWIRHFHNRLSVKYTNVDNGEPYYSLAFIINYKGRSSILSR
jgi:hypothetical protein